MIELKQYIIAFIVTFLIFLALLIINECYMLKKSKKDIPKYIEELEALCIRIDKLERETCLELVREYCSQTKINLLKLNKQMDYRYVNNQIELIKNHIRFIDASINAIQNRKEVE